ncbi:MAG: hypothetical protein LQ340_005734 [Diploschistes diacapsis]|nr:MAG: hypothetical protein LQ340_005734 [Diploschistes diacapsis]
MTRLPRRWYITAIFLLSLLTLAWLLRRLNESTYLRPAGLRFGPRYVNKLPTTQPRDFIDIQFKFGVETDSDRDIRELRRAQVKEVLERAWSGYKQYAWLKDELQPIAGSYATTFGGWGATLVDSLDTLWIMGMKEEFEVAVNASATIDFSHSDSETINVFETTIRYLGGYLGAYDISDGAYPVLLIKAVEVGELLYKAFDTPNRMPVTRWNWGAALSGEFQEASDTALVAELGSLTLEFTRLSQLTSDSKYYDAVYTIMQAFERSQRNTKVPGLWPTVVNAKALTFTGTHFTIGGMADSVYEYLPKEYMLLGGTISFYKPMYERALLAMKSVIFFRPMVPNPLEAEHSRREAMSTDPFADTVDRPSSPVAAADVLLPGVAMWDTRRNKLTRAPEGQHLGCFAGGMVALAAKVFGTESEDIPIAQRLVNGCIWAYESMPTGIMPEVFHVVPCEDAQSCNYDRDKWYEGILQRQRITDKDVQELVPEEKINLLIKERGLEPGYTAIDNTKYILRPEAIESIFVLYRLTGNKELLEAGWRMFEAIDRNTATSFGNSAIHDVTVRPPFKPQKEDRMESFWLAETLKYFYLLFSGPDLVSLDKFVL